jgi:hypothetical protein
MAVVSFHGEIHVHVHSPPECGCVFVQERKLQQPNHLISSPSPNPNTKAQAHTLRLLFLFMVRPMFTSTLCPECGCVFVQERKLQLKPIPNPKPKHQSSNPYGPCPRPLFALSVDACLCTQKKLQPQSQAQALKLKPEPNPKPKHLSSSP